MDGNSFTLGLDNAQRLIYLFITEQLQADGQKSLPLDKGSFILHNAQLPISRLPNEVLIEIFLYFVDSTPVIVLLSHVCRKWRDVLVHYPSVWSSPNFSRPQLAKEMIQRSKPGPLHIHLNSLRDRIIGRYIITPMSLSVLIEALAETSRIQSLYLTSGCATFDIIQRLLLLLVRPMTSLRELYVHTYELTTVWVEFSDTFFDDMPPCLEVLDLDYCKMPWSRAVFTNVTSLSLRGDGLTNLPTGLQFLDALAGMPRLEYLCLIDVFPLSFADSETSTVVELPRLRTFFPQALCPSQSRSCVETLSRLLFPHEASIWTHISYDQTAFQPSFQPSLPYGTSEIFHLLFDKVAARGTIQALQLYTRSLDNNNLYVNFWSDLSLCTTDGSFQLSDGLRQPSVGAVLEWYDILEWPPAEAIIRQLGQSMSLSSLVVLDVRLLDENESVQMLFELVVHSTTLRQIIVGGEEAYVLISILGGIAGDTTRSRTPPFPALQDLDFWNVNFGSRTFHSHLLPLLVGLESRPEKLQRLSLKKCNNLTTRDIEQLREMTVELRVESVVAGIKAYSVDVDSEEEEDGRVNFGNIEE
ncbi:hypothetical protein VNI00_010366 [Paramarasmius palmivorus]|uniref:F-box domain-containing protein n=1 Tax=Paramarasmius palmivorus TaxID=297713 RepID=A0AAW0CKZ2_9AGAR